MPLVRDAWVEGRGQSQVAMPKQAVWSETPPFRIVVGKQHRIEIRNLNKYNHHWI